VATEAQGGIYQDCAWLKNGWRQQCKDAFAHDRDMDIHELNSETMAEIAVRVTAVKLPATTNKPRARAP
jgi:hypothetical protein